MAGSFDRLPDGLVLTEASCCSAFMRNETRIVTADLKHINPDLEGIDGKQFLGSFLTCSA